MQFLNKKFLLGVLLVIVALTIFVARPNWQIGGDGYGYYVYLRSLHFDCDFNFLNEFTMFDSLYKTNTAESRLTSIGKVGNPFAIGWSFFYAPFLTVIQMVKITVSPAQFKGAFGSEILLPDNWI